jgi:hypothetical protein
MRPGENTVKVFCVWYFPYVLLRELQQTCLLALSRHAQAARVAGVAVVGGLAVGLFYIVMLGALDGRSRFIEQRPATERGRHWKARQQRAGRLSLLAGGVFDSNGSPHRQDECRWLLAAVSLRMIIRSIWSERDEFQVFGCQ